LLPTGAADWKDYLNDICDFVAGNYKWIDKTVVPGVIDAAKDAKRELEKIDGEAT